VIAGLAIKHGCKVPDGILLAYPVLDVAFKYSPSHVNGLKDAILSHTVMEICIKVYTGFDYCDPNSDPFVSPVYLSDEIL
jgi:hormone-sensitive lipase